MSKHIEICKPEEVAAQVIDTQPAALTPVQDAAKAFGLPYKPAKEPSIPEIKGALSVFVQRLRQLIFAPAIAKVQRCYETILPRVSGRNEPAATFPDGRTDSEPYDLAHLPQALAALSDRKISNGNALNPTDGYPEIPDGISLARLLCEAGNLERITEIIDTNKGWVMTAPIPSSLSNAKKITLGCKKATTSLGIPSGATDLVFPELEDFNRGVLAVCDGDGEVAFPKLKHIVAANNNVYTINLTKAKKLVMESLENVESIGNVVFCKGAKLEEIDWRSFKGYGPSTWGGWATLIGESPELRKVKFGTLIYSLKQANADSSILSLGEKCIHFEVGQGTAVYMQLNTYSPTTALDPNDSTLLEDEHIAAGLNNNLDGWMYNFRKYIIHRLADRKDTTALTLTLSSAVYNVVRGTDSTARANTLTIGDLGGPTAKEVALGITNSTTFASWLTTYTGANGIHWTIQSA